MIPPREPNPSAAPPVLTTAEGGDDYLDKGLAAAQKKFGGTRFNDPANAQKNRAMNEKITDGIRKFVEKITGKKAPAKFSN